MLDDIKKTFWGKADKLRTCVGAAAFMQVASWLIRCAVLALKGTLDKRGTCKQLTNNRWATRCHFGESRAGGGEKGDMQGVAARMGPRRGIWLCTLCLSSLMAQAQQPQDDKLDRLAETHQWKRLLHTNEQGVSEVNTPAFFLADHGRINPREELRATVAALSQPWSGQPDEHPRCRFPARYLWLSQHIPLPGYIRRDARCSRLEEWARLDHLQSISVYFVSGYFGNPASTFGHALVKFNADDGQDTHGLLDMSVGFGALVPDNELTAVYVYRGIFGGYQAGFSDKPHYHNDVTYGHTEFRDMWDYKLKLNDLERELFVLHVAEIAGKKFDYFFLNKNCATRIGELIEAATGLSLVRSAKLWYMPIELFQALEDAHARGPEILAHPPQFIPSAERKMLHAFAQLPTEEAHAARAVARSGAAPAARHLDGLGTEAKIKVLNAVLAYHEYGLIKAGDEAPADKVKAKNAVLADRLSLPVAQLTPDAPPPRPSPAQGHAPMLFEAGISHSPGQGTGLQLRWAMSSYEPQGFHGIDNGALMVMDTTLSIHSNQSVRLDQLDVVRVMKLNPPVAAIDEEWPWSWHVRLGTKRVQVDGDDMQRVAFEFAAGRAVQWSGMTAYAMLGGVVQDQDRTDTFAVDPVVGLSGGSDQVRWMADAGVRQGLGSRSRRSVHGRLQLAWRLARDHALRLHIERDEGHRGGVGVQAHW